MSTTKPHKLPYLHYTCAFILLSLTSGLCTLAQNTQEQVTIIGTFQPSLKESAKIAVIPDPVANPITATNQELSRVDVQFPLKIVPEPVSPLQPDLNDRHEPLRNHLNLGVGTNLSPVFDFLHHSALSQRVRLNILTKHRSSWTQVRDHAPSEWMTNKARVSADVSFGEHSLRSGITYSHDQFHWYGFKPNDHPGFDGHGKNLLQHFGLVSADALWRTNFRDPASVNHHLGIQLNFLNDRYETFEHAFLLSGGAIKEMNIFSTDGKQYALLDAHMSYVAEGDTTMSKATFMVHANPALGLKGSFYSVEAGLGLSSAQSEKTYFHLLPKLNGHLFVFDDKMEISASFGGRLEHHTRRAQWTENPYLRTTDSSFVTTIPVDFQVGIKGNPFKGVMIRFAFSHLIAQQMGFFVIDRSSAYQHLYQTVFDDATRKRITTEIRYETSNNIRTEIIMHFDKYEMSTLPKPWHLPTFQMIFNSSFPVNTKLAALTKAMILAGRFSPDASNMEQKLKNVTDISLGAQYQHSKSLWFFANIDNLLNQRYPRFDAYPVQGAQLVAGMKLNF